MISTSIRLKPEPITLALLEQLQAEGLIRLFNPTERTIQALPGENAVESLYESPEEYGPHKLIAVGVNKYKVRLGTHPDHEEFLIPAHGNEVKPVYLLICRLRKEEALASDRQGTLKTEDFTCLSLYPAPRGAEMFTMLAGTLHCEFTIPGDKAIGPFYVTESRDLPIEWIDLNRHSFELDSQSDQLVQPEMPQRIRKVGLCLTEPDGNGQRGVVLKGPGRSTLTESLPVRIEIRDESGETEQVASGYDVIKESGSEWIGEAVIRLSEKQSIRVTDRYSVEADHVRIHRSLKVAGRSNKAFLSQLTFRTEEGLTVLDANVFAPGMLYGTFNNITKTAIGGMENYVSGMKELIIREDRMPAPTFGLHFKDGSSVAILHENALGDTTFSESMDTEAVPFVDARFQFGSLGCVEEEGALRTGFWFPGTEGGATYSGDTFPHGQMKKWRRRYHPLTEEVRHDYSVSIRFGQDESFPRYFNEAWRRAWTHYAPEVVLQDSELIRRSQNKILHSVVDRTDGRVTLPIAFDSVSGKVLERDAYMGFTGRSIETAYFLLREAARDSEAAYAYRESAYEILRTFCEIQMCPPTTEGFAEGGGWINVIRDQPSLRALSEGARYMLKAWEFEKQAGRDHSEWHKWAMDFGNWLLGQELPGGGYPRTWKAGTGEPAQVYPESSYNAIPFLIQAYDISGNPGFIESAVRTGELCWIHGQRDGFFVGGTLDNPNVIDKEAATISMRAYMTLYEATWEPKWLERAKAAGDAAETWIYCWNVPMPTDATDEQLHWKQGVSTVGVQLIATGHSLADTYMAFDVAEYAKLYKYTGDEHYAEVSRILLHNTKLMMAMPGRPYDLHDVGWIQEHWSIAPRRGVGMSRIWLPWVAVSHLCGIVELEDFDTDLYRTFTTA
ncbi:hypothetical protein D7Z26_21505 [Cohnella endophytica]|uniref:Uncharacterized protein n=1 Tax=Cohnella endophytica TaxID=2419778 RepID=A0A494XDV5_9BACL|nr:hypothetical protein [Cohnella endophytica]RKP48935.1 hypothetical protein D7Z26_21505 [Cohnella endophytica]